MSFLASHEQGLAQAETRQDSLLDILEPSRATIPKTHFVEWFSGDVLDSIWDQNTIFGAPVFSMVDAIGGGFSISHGAVDPTQGAIGTNTERHFNSRKCKMESVQRRVSANGRTEVGFSNRTDGDFANTPDEAMTVQESNALTFKRLITITTVNTTAVNTSIASNTNFFHSSQELLSASAELRINGILEATSTTFLPTVAAILYAGFKQISVGANVGESRITYMEAYNT